MDVPQSESIQLARRLIPLQSLVPTEMWDVIISNLPTEKSDSTLRSVALVSRYFAGITKRHLFRHVTFYAGSSEAFAEFLYSSPKAADHVQDLQMYGWPNSSKTYGLMSRPCSVDVDLLARMLSKLPKLRNLTLRGVVFVSRSEDYSHSLQYDLRSLFVDIDHYPSHARKKLDCLAYTAFLRMLSLFHNVEALSLGKLPIHPCHCITHRPEANDVRSCDAVAKQIFTKHPPKPLSIKSLEFPSFRLPFETALAFRLASGLTAVPSHISICLSTLKSAELYNEFLNTISPALQSCTIDILASPIMDNQFRPLEGMPILDSLSQATSLKTLELSCYVTVSQHRNNYNAAIFLWLHKQLLNAYLMSLQHLTLQYRLDWMLPISATHTNSPSSLISAYCANMDWDVVRAALRRCISLAEVTFKVDITLVSEYRGTQCSLALSKAIQVVVEKELAEWQTRKMLKVVICET